MIKTTDILLLGFGGTVETGNNSIKLVDSYEDAFSYVCNKEIWNTIDNAPFNRNCLQDEIMKI